jgi:RNA polymerase sigma-70 factor (ECF subfamily)
MNAEPIRIPTGGSAFARSEAAVAPLPRRYDAHTGVGQQHRSGEGVLSELVRAAQAGDHQAFAALARHASNRLYGIARRILGDPHAAEDATQDALVDIWREIRAIRDPERFDAWSTRILVRACQREIGRRRRLRVTSPAVEAASEHDAYGQLADRDVLEQAFRRLPLAQREVLVLHHHLGLEPTELVPILGVPAGTVRSRLHYAHRALRAAVDAVERPGSSGSDR